MTSSPGTWTARPPIYATRFRRDFWMPERGCHALALDGEKRQVDSVTSNIGHLLWSGLLDEVEAAVTAERLLDMQLYSGWGVRTLGTREAGYNPLGYHTGTVWPHENSLIASGLRATATATRRAPSPHRCCAAAPFFEHRLPEVFAGFPAPMTTVPVAFPTASRPQAWAAGTPLLLLSTLLDLQPGCTDADVEVAGRNGRCQSCNLREASVKRMDDDEVRALVTRLARPHSSGGDVIERSVILAEGAASAELSRGPLPTLGHPMP